jgi:AraC-like DNA-binding protein
MPRINTHIFTIKEDEQGGDPIALFKKVNINPKQNDFLLSRIKTLNYCIISINSGEFNWIIDGENYHITSNDLVLVCPNLEMVKEYKPIEFGNFYKISLKPDYYFDLSKKNRFAQLIQKPEALKILTEINLKKVLIIKNFINQKQIFYKIEHEFISMDIGYQSRINSLIEELIIEIYRIVKKGQTCNQVKETEFQHLKEALASDISHNWTVKEMAKYTDMGITQFSNKMKMCLGFSPFDFLIYLRLNKAANLLQTTDYPITQIAFDTGFYSPQHFSFTFKKIIGTTPSKFRRQA